MAYFQVATDLWPVLKWPRLAAFEWPPRPADAPMSAESAQASFPPAGPEAAEGAAVIPQPIEARDGFTQAFSGSYAQGRRIAELLAELLDDTSDEAP